VFLAESGSFSINIIHIPITFSCFTFKTKNCYMTQLSHFETVLLVWVSCYRWKGGRRALWQSLTDFRFKCKTWNPDSAKNTIYDGFVVALDWASSDFCIVMHELYKFPHTSVIFNVAACLYTYYWRFISTWHSETWRCFSFVVCFSTKIFEMKNNIHMFHHPPFWIIV
jgi:hypothetical protein